MLSERAELGTCPGQKRFWKLMDVFGRDERLCLGSCVLLRIGLAVLYVHPA